tara:strand:- start:291 stop:614 length:324 start_codon:yes stop_codon:yes gene_type:complete
MFRRIQAIILWTVFALSSLSLMLLAFAYRDFSALLILQYLFTAICLPLSTFHLIRNYNPAGNFAVTKQNKVTGILAKQYQVIKEEREEDSEELNLEGKFCLDRDFLR